MFNRRLGEPFAVAGESAPEISLAIQHRRRRRPRVYTNPLDLQFIVEELNPASSRVVCEPTPASAVDAVSVRPRRAPRARAWSEPSSSSLLSPGPFGSRIRRSCSLRCCRQRGVQRALTPAGSFRSAPEGRAAFGLP